MATENRSQQVSAAHLEVAGISAVQVETAKARKQPGFGSTVPKPLWVSSSMQQKAGHDRQSGE